jgi:hypothetical protein
MGQLHSNWVGIALIGIKKLSIGIFQILKQNGHGH